VLLPVGLRLKAGLQLVCLGVESGFVLAFIATFAMDYQVFEERIFLKQHVTG
jgi:hypothetical protein